MSDIPSNMDQVIWEKRKQLEEAFTGEGLAPVEASADGLVTVSIDGHCRLASVSLHGVDLEPIQRQRIEAAIVAAVREGTDKVAQRQAERVRKIVTEVR